LCAEIFGVNGFAAQSFSAWYRDVSVSGNGVTAETMIIIGFSGVLRACLFGLFQDFH
jgi:hypothetical protein